MREKRGCYPVSMHADDVDLIAAARLIFTEALKQLDAGDAVRRAIRATRTRVSLVDSIVRLGRDRRFFAVALGKAAEPMAAALDDALGGRLAAGVLSGTLDASAARTIRPSNRWRRFAGGHPLPNEESFAAARAALELLNEANQLGAPVIFLISGGGSAMMEAPRDSSITLDDLRETNRILIGCGATIAEVNAVRRALSAVKGGGLARAAANSDQVTLIVSDTNTGDEAAVASGPTIQSPGTVGEAALVVIRYHLDRVLPQQVLNAIRRAESLMSDTPSEALRRRYVLLNNRDALERAAEAARRLGFIVEIASDVIEQDVAAGCEQLLARLVDTKHRSSPGAGVCLLSGGEFSCPVRGRGLGGRNAETALRWALAIDGAPEMKGWQLALLSAGTDGIDGNSPAAGAIASHLSLRKARAGGLDARGLLESSDAYTFFNAIGDAVVTGPTLTNVRDLRIMLAR